MKGYGFIYGFYDVAPAYEEGVYLDYNEAYERLKELTIEAMQINKDHLFYENGYGEDYYPENNTILKNAEESEDRETYDKEMKKHILTNIDDICNSLIDNKYPPFNFYTMIEIEIK